MKKGFFVLFAAIILPLSIMAQNPHLQFKGIPISGKISSFSQKLTEKGFKTIGAQDGIIIMQGTFMATPATKIILYPDPSTNNIASVVALMDGDDNWVPLEKFYNNVVDTYKEKYGEPTEFRDEFTAEQKRYNQQRNAILDKEGDYKTIWTRPEGQIVISFAHEPFHYYVMITYIDTQNQDALHKTIIDDI